MLKQIILATLAVLVTNTVLADDIEVSFVGSAASERGARNLGLAFSQSGLHLTVSGKLQHQSGFLVEAATGNSNSEWDRVDEFAIGWASKFGNNWLVRADVFRLHLNGAERSDETVDSARVALIATKGKIKPYLFLQQILSGLPGEGLAVRPGTKLPGGFYAEATFHDRLFNQTGWTHSSSRLGWQRQVDDFSFNLAWVDGKSAPINENRWRAELVYKFK